MIQENNHDTSRTAGYMTRLVAEDLKRPLLQALMACDAMTSEDKHRVDILFVRNVIQQELQSIDSLLLASQLDYGQLACDFETVQISSVFYDIAESLKAATRQQNIDLRISLERPKLQVVGNTTLLKHAVLDIVQTALHILSSQPTEARRTLVLGSHRLRGTVAVGIHHEQLSKNFISLAEKTKANPDNTRVAQRRPFRDLPTTSGSHLLVAGMLFQSMGSRLRSLEHEGVRGFGANLTRSEQIRLFA
jgi:hypothetical protein